MIDNPFDTDALSDSEPDVIIKGAYYAWRRNLSEISGPDYSVKYEVMPVAGGTAQTVSGTENGDYWEFEILGSATTSWSDGDHRWDLLVVRTSDSEGAVVESDVLSVFADDADRRTHAEIMVVKIESLLNGRADHDVESYSIKQRSLTRMSVKELTMWRDYYLDEIARTGGSVSRENSAKSNTVRVRFI